MTCCDEKTFGSELYMPLNERLLDFGKKSSTPDILNNFPNTFVWLFTFCKKTDLDCFDCLEKFQIMVNWFNKYNLLKNPVNNLKWIFDDNIEENNICLDIGITNSPTHIITDKDGNIMNIVLGFPDEDWLNKYLLPYFSKEIFKDET